MNTPHLEQDAATGIYLYCLLNAESLAQITLLTQQGLPGVDVRYPITVLKDGESDGSVVAIVSEVLISDFSEDNLQDLNWIGERAGRHEAVVSQMMLGSTVLPVKFGTIYRSRESLITFLKKHEAKIVKGLQHLSGKAEWSVKGYLNEDEARKLISLEDSAIQNRLGSLSLSPGARYLQQKQLDVMIESALDADVIRVSNHLHQVLIQAAAEATTLRRHSSLVTGRFERMVYNASFLLSQDALPEFQAVLADQQDSYQRLGLSLELRGPWPAYNFCPNLTEEST